MEPDFIGSIQIHTRRINMKYILLLTVLALSGCYTNHETHVTYSTTCINLWTTVCTPQTQSIKEN